MTGAERVARRAGGIFFAAMVAVILSACTTTSGGAPVDGAQARGGKAQKAEELQTAKPETTKPMAMESMTPAPIMNEKANSPDANGPAAMEQKPAAETKQATAAAEGEDETPKAKQPLPYMDYISTPEEVDYDTKVTFGPRPGFDVPGIAKAWKEIVADVYRKPIKVIIDTDIGTDVDDAMALCFALRRPELQVMGVTTSRKMVYQRAAIVSQILQNVGRTDVLFAPGSPVMATGVVSPETKPVNEFPFAGPENDRPKPTFNDAQELYKKVLSENPGEVWLVITGTFTNAAILVRDHPDVAKNLKGIACLGGSIKKTSGGTNVGNDHEAAVITFRSGYVKFAVSGVTYRLLMTKRDVERLKEADTPTSRTLHELITKYWKPFNAPHKPGPVAFDVAPYIWLVAPDLFTTEEKVLTTESKITPGVQETAPCTVVTDFNTVGLHRMIMDTLTEK